MFVFQLQSFFSLTVWGNAMTFPLWSGASCILFPERPTPQSTFDVIKRYMPSIFFGVPTLYAAHTAGT
ncbi:MAG: hypothetical protein CM1200mP30_05400 [Pseudomonadota bacterium]|nr:MAG: hypothetical protein CM1200mP30_05400 [Pseudomonadota bacterium]